MPATSVHKRILDQVQTDIQALSLTGITSTNIVVLTVPEDAPKYIAALPAIIISPFGREQFFQGTNKSDDIGYPVTIVIVDSANEDQTTDLDTWLLWRQKIIDKYSEVRITGFSGTADANVTHIEAGPIVNAEAWTQKQLFISVIGLRAVIRKQRGSG